jgi:hypothetical protein
MAPVLNATLAGPESNSYVTLADADTIAGNMPFYAEWGAATDEDKTIALIVSTNWLETLDYIGDRCDPIQNLKWPRQNASCDGVLAVCTLIPYKIRQTEVMLAMAYIRNPNSFPDTGGGGSVAPTGTYVKRQKLDVLEIEYDEFSNPESSSCDTCGDPIIIQKFAWLADLLGCWAIGIATGDNKMIRLFRN